MRAPHLLVLCVLGAALLSSVLCNHGHDRGPCCFVFQEKELPKARIRSYQETHPSCPKKGVIFTKKKDKKICVHPTPLWVQLIMKQLDDKSL